MSWLAPGERLEELIGEDRVLARVAELAREIEESCCNKPLTLVVVLKGALVFAADLIRQIGTPLTIDFIAASSYRGSTRSTGEVALAGIDRLDLEGRHALVVEDSRHRSHDCGGRTGRVAPPRRDRSRHQPADIASGPGGLTPLRGRAR